MIIVLLVLLLFALGYVVITKKKRTQSNVSSKFNTPAVDTKVNAPVNESCTENKIVEFPDNATTQTETADITKESAPFVTQPSSVITSGENEYYKELLWDNRWIQKRDNRKRIDHYVCQNCYNTIKLDNIGEVSKYVDSSELADIVISAFNEENSLQQNDDETYDAKIDIRHVELLEGKSWNMSTALEEIYVEMSTTKKFSSNGSFYDSLLTWQKDGGRFEVQRTIVNWAPLVLVGKGKIAFNGQLEPSISLMTKSKGAEQTLDNLGNAQIFDSKNVFVAKILLSTKQKEWEAQGNKEGTFSLPISYSDGQFNIENISMLPQNK